MNPVMRMSIVTCLKIMRGKDVVSPSVVLPVLFKLFRCEDKQLRRFIHSNIVNDLKKLNEKHKVQNIDFKDCNFEPIDGLMNCINCLNMNEDRRGFPCNFCHHNDGGVNE